ncbi:hypothetical protein GCM10022253_30170 [Sphingomonas endophytica]
MYPKSRSLTRADLAIHRPTAAQLAALLGVSTRRIFDLRARHIMPLDGATLHECIRAWVEHGGARG